MDINFCVHRRDKGAKGILCLSAGDIPCSYHAYIVFLIALEDMFVEYRRRIYPNMR
ncbi:hypothetical protein HMPREF0663_12029 [Hoylesella oralis ATCC 33269]|uniref:Uncharacterized protein n=1 Tax=Hoylesella oralis ATCC 33269 TaxID=873533 RepID=E7RTF6_9BACT|nr:hypothetical protein HMPREF0663_12029 [Hoylesella oralis ATCC 33269]